MAKGNFPACLAVTLKHEGGWSDHPKDPGGATMKGVTIGTFRAFKGRQVTKDELRAISDDDLQAIYKKGYWAPISGDFLPKGVDLAVFDYGVNSGPARAVRALQGLVGVTQDGRVGPKTVRAASTAVRGDELVKKLCAQRLSFVRGLATWSTFGRGWTRRIAEIEAVGVSMWLSANATPAGRKMGLEAEAERAAKAAKTQSATATAAGAGGVTGGATDIALDPSMLLIGLAALVVVAGALFVKARSNRARAVAYAVAAAEVAA